MGLKTASESKRYLYILKDGQMHEKAEEGAVGAKMREFEDKDGKVIEKWEYSYPGIVGMVESISFRDSDYGTNINIDIKDEDDNEFVLSLKATSKYGESFMEALPNLDLTQEVDFTSYSFPDKKNPDRRIQGLTVKQNDEKVRSYFATYDADTKTWSYSVKGYPVPDPKKKYTTEKWKIFIATRNEWLKDYMIENDFIKASDGTPTEDVPTDG
jgi:hypothetical protein